MRNRGVWLAALALMMVMTTTVSAFSMASYSGMVHLPSGEEQKGFYTIPPVGGMHTLEIGAWPSMAIAARLLGEGQTLADSAGPLNFVEAPPISRVQFKVYNPRTYEVLLDFDGSVAEFVGLGTLLADDYVTPPAFKFHMEMEFPAGVECWYAELVIFTGENRAGHADMRIYAGGYRRFVDTYGMWY